MVWRCKKNRKTSYCRLKSTWTFKGEQDHTIPIEDRSKTRFRHRRKRLAQRWNLKLQGGLISEEYWTVKTGGSNFRWPNGERCYIRAALGTKWPTYGAGFTGRRFQQDYHCWNWNSTASTIPKWDALSEQIIELQKNRRCNAKQD